MNKAFIFDMDGVIIDSEPYWKKNKKNWLKQVFGNEVGEILALQELTGLSANDIYFKGVDLGANIELEDYLNQLHDYGRENYTQAKITEGIEDLVYQLLKNDFRLGLVSSSPGKWIDMVLDRIPLKNSLDVIISINDRDDLRGKPEPDGYIEAINKLNSIPEKTIILEDSKTGLKAAKSSGAFAIGLKENWSNGYKVEEKFADFFIDKLTDLNVEILL